MKLATVFTLLSSFVGVAAIKPDLSKETSSRAADTKRKLRSQSEKFENLQDILNEIGNIEDQLDSMKKNNEGQIGCPRDIEECLDGSEVVRNPANDCQFDPCPQEYVCPTDVKECEDGSYVNHNPDKDCAFDLCPEEIFCGLDVKECLDGSYVSRNPSNSCNFHACPQEKRCPTDVKECDDGSYVNHNPDKDCAFDLCPEEIFCEDDVKECPDGSYVSRNPSKDCEFDPCPEVYLCPTDVKECDDGSYVNHNPDKNCAFDLCPEEIACGLDVKECPDGSYVSRSPSKDCEFDSCPQEKSCPTDVKECDDGSYVNHNPDKDCAFDLCPEEIACDNDVKECPDGSYVSRNPSNDCEFDRCPEVYSCPTDVKECDDGSYMSRNPSNDCNFHVCPKNFNHTHTVTFDDGTEGWHVWHSDKIVDGGNPGANLQLWNPASWGFTLRNTGEDYSFGGNFFHCTKVIMSIDVKVNAITFEGREVSRNLLVQLRNSKADASVYITAGELYKGGWTTFEINIPIQENFPELWKGFGSDPQQQLPSDITYGSVLRGVDDLTFTSYEPDMYYDYAAFDLQVDNISVIYNFSL